MPYIFYYQPFGADILLSRLTLSDFLDYLQWFFRQTMWGLIIACWCVITSILTLVTSRNILPPPLLWKSDDSDIVLPFWIINPSESFLICSQTNTGFAITEASSVSKLSAPVFFSELWFILSLQSMIMFHIYLCLFSHGCSVLSAAVFCCFIKISRT